MGEIILTMPGPWGKAPALDTRIPLSFGPADADLAEDFRALAQIGESVTPAQLAAVDAHEGVLVATLEVESPGDLTVAAAGITLAQAAFGAGALGLYVETSAKVYGPDGLDGIDPRDPTTLFHFYVEFVGDPDVIVSEGMQAFGLPDVAVRYDPETRDAAAGAAFSLAAQLVVDGLQVETGQTFRASESAPLYTAVFEELPPSDEDYVNPHGRWLLRSGSLSRFDD